MFTREQVTLGPIVGPTEFTLVFTDFCDVVGIGAALKVKQQLTSSPRVNEAELKGFVGYGFFYFLTK